MSELGDWIIHSVGLGVGLAVLATFAILAREVAFYRRGPGALRGPSTVVATVASAALLAIILARFVVIA